MNVRRKTQRLARRLSLSSQFVCAFGFLVILPVAFVSLRFTRELGTTVSEQVLGRSREIVSQAAELVDRELRTLTIRFSALVNDSGFQAASERFATADGQVETLFAVRELDQLLGRFFLDSDALGSVYIVPERDRRFYAYQNTPAGAYLDEVPVDRYAGATETPGTIRLIGDLDGVVDHGDRQPYVTLAVVPSRHLRLPGVRAVLVSSRLRSLGRTFRESSPLLEDGSISVLNMEKAPMFSAGFGGALQPTFFKVDPPVQEGRSVIRARGSEWSIISAPIHLGEWSLIHVQEAAAVNGLIARQLIPLYFSVVAIAAGFVGFTLMFVRSIVSPLHALADRMSDVEQGRFDVSLPTRGAREISTLTGSFNSMVRRISELTQATELKERARAEAELEALQYQINPHFVSNTLNSIRLMAQASGTQSIARMTGSLMQIVSDSLRTDEREVTLQRELTNIEHYCFIMKVRFGESFDFRIDVPDEHRDYRLLKMLIQPLVENAIVHGAQQSGRNCEIVLESESSDGALQIRVRDDGVGMDPPKFMAGDDPQPRGRRTVGLRNVHRRISLHYGESYGLQVASVPGQGTMVTLHLPPIGATT